MEIWVGLILLCCIGFIMSCFSQSQRISDEHIVLEEQIIHLAGQPYFKSNQKILFQIKSESPNHNRLYIQNKLINTKDIIRCELLTKEQISKDVTFSRLLTLGIFAIAFKKKRTVTETFMAFSYKVEGVQVDCLFKGILTQQLSKLTFQIKKLMLNANSGIKKVIEINLLMWSI
ncbi:hypothetical protein CLRAG_33740 [Clostridium ragsdalei P11]|uniref:Uncharacterized protein n=1 Tax=Clostridium ragsdalei P11 TaxID=1353534 RepID=A0A1A6AL03_9CLOT|nr:hypothetical protein [Clostridium ragsdalei]OBR90726.1 hypothetical protein CLRAG_33740 [Clostridium ragsdalei P11]